MRKLNLDQLRTLATVIELGSFTAAAKRLHLTQPAVSLQIRDLESRYGVRLVDRLGKRAFPTAAGRDLIEHAHRIIQESARAEETLRRHRDGWLGRVHIGASTTALIYHMPPALQRLREAHPNLELVVTTGTTSGVVERMLSNVVDIGVVSLPVDNRIIEAIPLRREPLVAVLPADTPNIPAKVTPEFMMQQTLLLEFARAAVRQLIVDWLSASGSLPRPAMEIDNLEAVKCILAAGLGASILPRAAIVEGWAEGQVIVRPLEPQLFRTLGLVLRRDKPADAALLRVREAMLTLAEKRHRQ